jgi:hypothetical protein
MPEANKKEVINRLRFQCISLIIRRQTLVIISLFSCRISTSFVMTLKTKEKETLNPKAMKTLSTNLIAALILVSLLVAPGFHALAGTTTGKSPNDQASRNAGVQASLTSQQAASYAAGLGRNFTSVAPASDGSGNFIATNPNGTHSLILVSGNNFNGLEDLPY